MTGRTGPQVAIEREVLRRQSRHRESRSGIAIIGRKFFLHPFFGGRQQATGGNFATPPAQRRFNRVGQSLRQILPHHQAIHDCLDPVGFVFIEANGFGVREFDDFPINAQTHEAFPPGFFNNVAKFAHLPVHHGCKDQKLRSHRPLQHRIRDFLGSLPRHTLPGGGIMRCSRCGKEKPQIIINLRRRRNGRSGIGGGRPLLNGNRGGQSLDIIHIGLLHLVKELASVG